MPITPRWGSMLHADPQCTAEPVQNCCGRECYSCTTEIEAEPVIDAWQVLRSEANVGGSVVIADWRGDWTGLGLAEYLAAAGRRVRLAVNGFAAGEALQSYVRDTMVARVAKLGVEIIPYARLFGADGTTAYLQDIASAEPILMEDVETLVLAHGQTKGFGFALCSSR